MYTCSELEQVISHSTSTMESNIFVRIDREKDKSNDAIAVEVEDNETEDIDDPSKILSNSIGCSR